MSSEETPPSEIAAVQPDQKLIRSLVADAGIVPIDAVDSVPVVQSVPSEPPPPADAQPTEPPTPDT